MEWNSPNLRRFIPFNHLHMNACSYIQFRFYQLHCPVIYVIRFCLTLSALMCAALPVPDNGGITYSTTDTDFPPYNLGTVADYSCNTGFGFPSVPISTMATCQSDAASLNGVWNGVRLTCSSMIDLSLYYS